jgi:hypothetical protein
MFAITIDVINTEKGPPKWGFCINASTSNFWLLYLQVNNNAKASAMLFEHTFIYNHIQHVLCKKHDDFRWSPCQTSPLQKIPKEKNTKINDDDFITYTLIAYIVNGIKK